MKKSSFLVLLFSLFLASCSMQAIRPVEAIVPESPVVISCADNFQKDTSVGRLTNNVWNKQAAGSFEYRQCIVSRKVNDVVQYGWSWSWPEESSTVFAYPESFIGWNPWRGGISTHAKLPIRIDAINSFKYAYAVNTITTGRHNLTTSLWLTRTGQTGLAPNPDDISTELLIWTDGSGVTPGGSRIAQTTLDGVDFEVWYAKGWKSTSEDDGNRWDYIAYRSIAKFPAATLDIKKILGDAVSRRLIRASHYVSNIETGNEIVSGFGVTWITSLSLDIQ
jgi:hypothetical protein